VVHVVMVVTLVRMVVMMILSECHAAAERHCEGAESYGSEDWFHRISCAPSFDSGVGRGVASFAEAMA
jgi:hypothetical protein